MEDIIFLVVRVYKLFHSSSTQAVVLHNGVFSLSTALVKTHLADTVLNAFALCLGV